MDARANPPGGAIFEKGRDHQVFFYALFPIIDYLSHPRANGGPTYRNLYITA